MRATSAWILSVWNDYFYRRRDPTVCSWIRVGLGSLLALYHAVVLPRAELFYGGQGVLSFDASRDFVDPDHWTLFVWLPDDTGMATALVALAMIQGILLAIGLASRFQAVCLYLLVYSLNYRNPLRDS